AVLISKRAFVSTVEQRSFVVTTNLTIRDRYVLSHARVAKRERTLWTNAIVEWRVDRAIRDAHVLACINIDAVAVCVYLKIVDGQVIDAGSKNCKVPAM